MAIRLSTDRAVPETLAATRALVEPAIRSALDRLAPDIHRVALYHFGFADSDGRPGRGAGGKALRPALALLSAEAAGAEPEQAIPGAVAVELVHNYSLIHDDVMDRDRERRHRPTVWALFGVGPAIVAGDALANLAQETLLERATSGRVRAAAALAGAAARMIAGQAQDLAFESRVDVSIPECLEMEANKTGALLSCASSIGAILAGGDDRVVSSLAEFGLRLGLAFQAIDDILGIWGHPEVTGKPVGSDLRQHKQTLPVVAALCSGTRAGTRLASMLSNGSLSDQAVAEATSLVEEAGGRVRALAEADADIEAAREALDRARIPSDTRARFLELADFITTRNS